MRGLLPDVCFLQHQTFSLTASAATLVPTALLHLHPVLVFNKVFFYKLMVLDRDAVTTR